MLCANCHREVHAGKQLLRETVVEKPGELREIRLKRTILSQAASNIAEGAETIPKGSTFLTKLSKDGKRLGP
ncbi:MAG TPA: hypothetical protein DCL44_05190 [Elusimicrobia bacterium]|nr:hypothetical protein [Elusimicrobiota bacterium]